MSYSLVRKIASVSWMFSFVLYDCVRSDIRSIHYRIDDRYADKLPTAGTLWAKTALAAISCLFQCQKDTYCVTIFFGNGGCYGFGEKLHDFIPTSDVPGMVYYEMAGPVGNLAIGKTYLQSSKFQGNDVYGPQKAADSIRNPFQNGNMCSHTIIPGEDIEDNSPFWQVDLGSSHLVSSVSFLSRIECCGERNQRLNITVAETNSGPRALCLYYHGPPFVGEMKTFFCEKHLYGQFVRISRDEAVLNPCEIEVYGYPLGP